MAEKRTPQGLVVGLAVKPAAKTTGKGRKPKAEKAADSTPSPDKGGSGQGEND